MEQTFQEIFVGPEVLNDVKGQEKTKSQLKASLMMGRHVIIVGPPGIGKTTLAKNVAKLLPDLPLENENLPFDVHGDKTVLKGAERFVRVQGSPDLTVEDLLGDIDPIKALEYGPLSMEAFTPGKIFRAHKGILFFDEVNRCPEKLQNALLQVLQEGCATIGSYTVDIPANFIFIGTMNPEDSSTERLSDVFADRFDMVDMSYPDRLDIEKEIVLENGKKLEVKFHDDLIGLAVMFVRNMRAHKDVERKPSVRASIGLYERAQAHAVLAGRDHVTPDDLEQAVFAVLSHRMSLKPSIKFLTSTEDFLAEQYRKFMQEHKERVQRGGP